MPYMWKCDRNYYYFLPFNTTSRHKYIFIFVLQVRGLSEVQLGEYSSEYISVSLNWAL
jgi:hypothetical protein